MSRFDSAAFAASLAEARRLRSSQQQEKHAAESASVGAQLRQLIESHALAGGLETDYDSKHAAAEQVLVHAATEGLLVLRRRLSPTG